MKYAHKVEKNIMVCSECGAEIDEFSQCANCLDNLGDTFYCLEEFEEMNYIHNRHVCEKCSKELEKE